MGSSTRVRTAEQQVREVMTAAHHKEGTGLVLVEGSARSVVEGVVRKVGTAAMQEQVEATCSVLHRVRSIRFQE